ncbi:dUTP diphosphatase [Radiobacillus kanasensis]|uniref:dUTP diphosphatase n=1 Tax=Radiobacillus kanasensis TaxID=2844358 RepID=UPI001E3ACA2D|nr:dUTP diphosphatase [Radiobacillus kanasensis]UFT97987.1 dUTP diphosphatase [Radiobacillus kanasensis]
MNWEKLFNMQRELDHHIETKHGLDKKDLFERKILALFVEVGELANETRCFKFWSTKAPSERDVILEEYVDGVHFILSLGLNKGFTYQSDMDKKQDMSDLTALFNHVFDAISLFKNHATEEHYQQLFNSYLDVGTYLGFDEEATYQAYVAKNEINHSRQNSGY